MGDWHWLASESGSCTLCDTVERLLRREEDLSLGIRSSSHLRIRNERYQEREQESKREREIEIDG